MTGWRRTGTIGAANQILVSPRASISLRQGLKVKTGMKAEEDLYRQTTAYAKRGQLVVYAILTAMLLVIFLVAVGGSGALLWRALK